MLLVSADAFTYVDFATRSVQSEQEFLVLCLMLLIIGFHEYVRK